MNIETKYNVGDPVWFMNKNQAYNKTIKLVQSQSSNQGGMVKTTISYYLETGGDMPHLAENQVFLTKEELLKSL